MKVLKYLFSSVSILGIAVAVWFYYPQYQIHQLKKHSVEASSNTVSYIRYFRDIKEPLIHHLALGDSVIRGYGADPNENLVSQFSAKLGEQIHKKIDFQNEGINGITSGKLNDMVQSGQLDGAIKKADIITINVGGNDILKMASGKDYLKALQTFDQVQSNFSKNLEEIAVRIKAANPNATLVFLELYNPLPPSDQVYSLADKLLPKWNLKIYETAGQFPSSIVVETTKVINGKKRQNLSPDGIHPNSAGYTAISDQMIYQFKHQYRKETV